MLTIWVYFIFYFFLLKKWRMWCLLSTCIIIPLHAKVVTKVVDPTSTPSPYNRSSCSDCHILPFVDIKVKESIEHVSDKEEGEGMEDDKGIITELLCMVPHWLHWMCSLLCEHWYGWVVPYSTSIYVPKLQYLNFPQLCLHHFNS